MGVWASLCVRVCLCVCVCEARERLCVRLCVCAGVSYIDEIDHANIHIWNWEQNLKL